MNPKMMVGPLLGVESDSVYTVCYLSDQTVNDCDLFVNDARASLRTPEMNCPFGSDTYIRTRNYAVLEEGTDRKVWVNWICEEEVRLWI